MGELEQLMMAFLACVGFLASVVFMLIDRRKISSDINDLHDKTVDENANVVSVDNVPPSDNYYDRFTYPASRPKHKRIKDRKRGGNI